MSGGRRQSVADDVDEVEAAKMDSGKTSACPFLVLKLSPRE